VFCPMTETRFHKLSHTGKLAYQFATGLGPTLVFLPGYMSDMAGGKAQAVLAWAQDNNRACLLLDYSGCGHSDGQFADGSLSQWRDEVLALIDHITGGPVVLIGSSMGGWLMLLIALAIPTRIAALVGIAAAPDFTSWGYPADLRAKLAAGETVYEANPYGPEPTPTHAKFWADGQQNLLLHGKIPLNCPVRLIHGQADTDVPHTISLTLAAQLCSDEVQVTLIKDGDHRLSRPQDLAVILDQIACLG
jgi:pimeloyl-ACP methyl ester carboxylesterase